MSYYDKDLKFVNKFGGRYDMYGAMTLRQIFTTANIGKKIRKADDAPPGKIRTVYGCKSNAHVAARVYLQYLVLVTKDIIAGEIIKLRKSTPYPTMQVGLIHPIGSDKELKHLRPSRVIAGLNFRDFDYRVPIFAMTFGPDSNIQDRVLNVPMKFYKKLIKELEGGKRYAIVKDYKNKLA